MFCLSKNQFINYPIHRQKHIGLVSSFPAISQQVKLRSETNSMFNTDNTNTTDICIVADNNITYTDDSVYVNYQAEKYDSYDNNNNSLK